MIPHLLHHQHPDNASAIPLLIYSLHHTVVGTIQRRWMETTMGWNDLGVVGRTIYEEEDEQLTSSSPEEFSPSPTPVLPSKKSWGFGADPDVVIRVQDSSFRLHKGPLTARSGYLRRRLCDADEITISPPLKLTVQTFTLVADFCYGASLAITPFNVGALRTAAELLGMTEISASGEENLLQKTESYFRRIVAVNGDCASIVLRSCFSLLPEAETAASLVSRCIEKVGATAMTDGGDRKCLDGFRFVKIEDLHLILESLSRRLTQSHDILYTIIDIYLKENNSKISEDQKIHTCNYIDCSILSQRLLMHAVQNPRMPLRFVVQAMFMEQLNTRHSIISDHHVSKRHEKKEDPVTLGVIIQRDAALRQVAHLKAVMNSTNSRIQVLERELIGMRKLLYETERIRSRIDSAKSASFRFSSDGSKIDRGQIGSISSINVRELRPPLSYCSEESSEGEARLSRRLLRGLMSKLRLQKKSRSPPVTAETDRSRE